MTQNPSSHRFICLICLILIGLDQSSKLMATQITNTYDILPWIRLIWVSNHGSAFGLFSQLPYYAYINGILTTGIIACLIYLIYKTNIKYLQWSYTLIVSGAIGNALDRLIFGYVNDFLDLHFGQTHWFVFNFADTYITVGCCLILYHEWQKKQHPSSNSQPI